MRARTETDREQGLERETFREKKSKAEGKEKG